MKQLLNFFSEYITEERKAKIEDVLSLRTEHIHVVVEDTYQDHNAGAIVRTCECFGVQQMSVIENKNEFSVSSGMARGAEKWMDLNFYQESQGGIRTCMDDLRNEGYRIISTLPNPSLPSVEDLDITQKIALFFGKEREGLSQVVIDNADASVSIPMVGFTSSLNISVSVAIILQILTEKLRRNSQINWQLSSQRKDALRLIWYYHSIPNCQRMLMGFLKSNPSIDPEQIKQFIKF